MEFRSMSMAFLLPFLSFLQLFLEAFLLGDIAGKAGNARNPSIFIADDIAAIPDVTHFAIGANDAVLRIVSAPSGLLIEEGESALVIIGMNSIEPGVGIVVQGAAGAAPNGLVGWTDI